MTQDDKPLKRELGVGATCAGDPEKCDACGHTCLAVEPAEPTDEQPTPPIQPPAEVAANTALLREKGVTP